jgi:predicted HAD superfamily Cof-like phosphohydrolase
VSFDWQEDVRKFHTKFGLKIGAVPGVPGPDTKKLRIELCKEETSELLEGLEQDNLVKIADGAVDSLYVILGTLISYGIDLQPIWNAVQRANMAKEGGGKRLDGKILKPKNWKHPDIQKLLDEQATGQAKHRTSSWEAKLP